MTLRKPEDLSVPRWLMSGLNLKTLMVATGLACCLYYSQASRITIVEQQQPELSKRVDDQGEQLRHKLDREEYERDQQHQQQQLLEIKAQLDRIETYLMEHPR